MKEAPILEMRNIKKRFPGVLALDGVNLAVYSGEIHALVGENGAGKSTLMKIIAGAYQKDSGEILLNGKPVEINTPADAQALGIAIIYQDLNLIPDLSVAENIFFGRFPRRGSLGRIDYGRLRDAAAEALEEINAGINPSSILKDLSIADRQLVAICKALSLRSKVLVMDEPTSSLSKHEVETLFEIMRKLKAQGVAIIFISHHLDEIFEIADHVTVLRDGRFVDSLPIAAVDKEALVKMMVGRKVDTLFPKEDVPIGEVVFEVRGLSQGKRLKNISFSLRRGEILGIAGLVGAGRSELAQAIFGSTPVDKGEILIEGRPVHLRSPHDAIARGMAFIPEDRGDQGLHLNMTIRENVTLASLGRFLKGVRVDGNAERQATEALKQQLDIKTPGIEQVVGFLSGGNQQKVAIAKWLGSRPKVLILDEPTRGIDVGAKSEIHRIMGQLAASGVGIIMISSELPEVLGVADRILVMSNGRVAAEFPRGEATPEKVMMAAAAGGAV
ncbi:MAG: sugar ABC transporter ATP-binding protein [Firmicutes bacterium]|nr:sugar ABC transporter ATP-binding protein [Bacillota bacterium]